MSSRRFFPLAILLEIGWGDAGLSAVTIVYPIVAFIQAVGTGLGMGGAIYFSIERARGQDKEANRLIAIANWLMLGFSVLLTTLVLFYNAPMLKLLGASGNMLPLAQEYIIIISFGTGLQIFGTGLVPFIRNLGGSSFAMISMVSGFATNIVFDYLFVWVWEQGMTGAALATVLGQGLIRRGKRHCGLCVYRLHDFHYLADFTGHR